MYALSVIGPRHNPGAEPNWPDSLQTRAGYHRADQALALADQPSGCTQLPSSPFTFSELLVES